MNPIIIKWTDTMNKHEIFIRKVGLWRQNSPGKNYKGLKISFDEEPLHIESSNLRMDTYIPLEKVEEFMKGVKEAMEME